MYILRVENLQTLERLESTFKTAAEARRAANIAYFASGYSDDMEITIISLKSGEQIPF